MAWKNSTVWSRWPNRYSFWDRYNGTKYQRLESHQKKDLTEEEKQQREWRARKSGWRDRRAESWRRGPGPYYKGERAKSHRQWTKRHLHHGRWEELRSDNWAYTQFVNSYRWS